MYNIYTHTHIWTSFTTTENSKLYNISAIRTVAQNTILIYSNTFFFFSFTMYKFKLSTQENAKHKPQKATKVHVIRSVGSHQKKKDWHESANESCQYHTGASPHSQPQCLARLTVSGGKSGVDINYTCRHARMPEVAQTYTHS